VFTSGPKGQKKVGVAAGFEPGMEVFFTNHPPPSAENSERGPRGDNPLILVSGGSATDAIFLENLEAPPGFEPGMEVLQTGPERLSC
jgi:hypothetical protein